MNLRISQKLLAHAASDRRMIYMRALNVRLCEEQSEDDDDEARPAEG